MCGISGEFSYRDHASALNLDALLRVREAMHRRGPDGAGLWHDFSHGVALAHRRLSIIDLATRSDQPLLNADASAALVFNGEIYNYRSLREELLAQGVSLRTTGDSEVVLELLAREGISALTKLRGMYALGFYQKATRSLILARDPYGIKPLYFADHNGKVIFASSVKALSAHGEISVEADPAAEVGFLLYGSVPEPLTQLAAVRALAPGSVLCFRAGETPKSHTVQALSSVFLSSVAAQTPVQVHAELAESVRLHMEADVPVGVFLSAGVDSGALLGLMRDASTHAIPSLTMRFREFENRAEDEGVLAQEVSAHYGASHHQHWVTQAEFAADLPNFLAAMDQPSIDGMNSWMVSKAMHALGVKVAISGLGGDELFGGYSSFWDLPRWRRRFAGLSRLPGMAELGRLLAPTALALGLHPKAPGMLEFAGSLLGRYLLRRGLFLPAELNQFIEKDRLAFGSARLAELCAESWQVPDGIRDDFAQVAYLEASRYMRNQLLRDTDWASMAHSVEVRVPLVDYTLSQRLMPAREMFQSGAGKRLLGEAPKTALPDKVITRPKTGFTTPVTGWQQTLPQLQGWRRYPNLTRANTPWARRYALALLELQRT